MNYEQLKDEVKQLADIAASVPEQFRDKCFELLLSNLISKQEHPKKDSASHGKSEVKTGDVKDEITSATTSPSVNASSTIPMTAQLRVFMRRATVTNEELDKVLMYDATDDGQVHFIREPHDIAVTAGQMEWALLLALKNAILKDSLTVDPEDVRSMCQDKGFYDSGNFAATFKRANNAKLFKGSMVNQGEAQQLTNDGQDALGKLVKRLASESQ